MLIYLWIGLGGAVGSMARHWLSGLVTRELGETFPWGTLIVNVTGCFVIGLFASLTNPEGRWLVGPVFRQFFMVGICGGYTTFSAFGLQTLNLARDGEWFKAGANSVASMVLCLTAVWLGSLLAIGLNPAKGD